MEIQLGAGESDIFPWSLLHININSPLVIYVHSLQFETDFLINWTLLFTN